MDEPQDDFVWPLGFRCAGVACGVKAKSGKLDFSLFAADQDAVGAAVYTQNRVRAASVERNEQLTPADDLRAVVINSGNANACTGTRGRDDNQHFAEQLASELGCRPEQCLVLSTGIIGEYLPMDAIRRGVTAAVKDLGTTADHFDAASRGMLTTDQGPKIAARTCSLQEAGDIRLIGAAKGAGMIGPRMATMLGVIMTDAHLTAGTAQATLQAAVDRSFNCISVDGHTSTNDTVVLLASGAAQAQPLSGDALAQFSHDLEELCVELARQIPADGEGASHLITIQVTGGRCVEDADLVARTIALSALVKTAIAGHDPNWGRIVSAAGYAGVELDPQQVRLQLNGHLIFAEGEPTAFDAAAVSRSLANQFETLIELDLGAGTATATHWTSDLNEAYVRLNSEYHT